MNQVAQVPVATNEPVLDYRPQSPETANLQQELKRLQKENVEIPSIINGEEVRSGDKREIRAPHNRNQLLGSFHHPSAKDIETAIAGCQKVAPEWAAYSPEARAAIFLRASELLATKYRALLNASTMLGQSKTVHQAEIDAACELIDFFRFNAAFQKQLHEIQPLSAPGMWNRMEYRPLEGFVFAVAPFNFTSIAVNLAASPVLMGNVCVWKPAPTCTYAAYFGMKLLEEAGLPPGVIQFVPGDGPPIGDIALNTKSLAGIHFTGSTRTFQLMWEVVGKNIASYKSYPRIVGETGGKDFIFAHPSADLDALSTAAVRGAFEFQGQKCSAASRAYIPKNLWPEFKDRLLSEVSTIRMGDVTDFQNFMGAVIDENAFKKIASYIDHAKDSPDAEILTGGTYDDSEGFFIQPTVIQAKRPDYKSMQEEIFGPVLTVYVYDTDQFEETLQICDQTSPYGLTGCIFAKDRGAIETALSKLTHSAGNFYINNKPTGAVVGQQPFGGSRASGTNDKAGSVLNLTRWVSVRTISETFVPPTDYRYPFMQKST